MPTRDNRPRLQVTRRTFLGAAGGGAAALVLGRSSLLAPAALAQSRALGYGDLVPDPGGVLDLPSGFQYRIISEEGTNLSDGRPVPGDHDGMAAFSGPGNTTILVRNHELRP